MWSHCGKTDHRSVSPCATHSFHVSNDWDRALNISGALERFFRMPAGSGHRVKPQEENPGIAITYQNALGMTWHAVKCWKWVKSPRRNWQGFSLLRRREKEQKQKQTFTSALYRKQCSQLWQLQNKSQPGPSICPDRKNRVGFYSLHFL